MNSRSLCILWLAVFTLAAARPKNKILSLGTDSEQETKIREKRKYEIPLVQELEEGGVGVKRESPPEAATEAPEPPKVPEGDGGAPEDALPPSARVKKQSPNNVCIKIGGCGKTVCGPIVSARGPVVSDMRAMLQGAKPILSLGDLQSAAVSELNDAASKLEAFAPVQGRTVDTMVAPIALGALGAMGNLGSLGYGTSAAYSAPPPAIDLAHSFFKPPAMPAVPAVPAVAVIAAPSHHSSHSTLHPWILPHLMPHLMTHVLPSLMPSIGSYFTPHRLEPTRFSEAIPTEIKQPVPAFPQPYYSADNALLCQPLRNQRLDVPQEFFYKPDLASDKSINVTDGSKKSQNDADGDEERRIREHLRKVNEIKEEISQLNRAAQRIVDQQERLTALHQRQMWGASGQGGQGGLGGQSSSQASEQPSGSYMGSGYYAHPAMPWGYSRSNILSYPRSQDDIDFFINLLRAGKKMGLLSDAVQPSVLSTIGDVLKGVQDGGKTQKDAVDGVSQTEDSKVSKQDKKLTK